METIKQSADMEKRTSFMEEASKGELKIGGQAVEEGKTFWDIFKTKHCEVCSYKRRRAGARESSIK